MIIQDKKGYLDYIKRMEADVNNLYNSINSNLVSETSKKEVEKIRSKILGKLVVISVKLSDYDIIMQSDWEEYKKQIDDLYKEMSDKVNQIIASLSHTKENVR